MKKDFYKTELEEQETIINIDYFAKNARCYTSRNSVYNRLILKLGEPTHTYYTKGQVSGAYWEVPLRDKKRMNIILSKTVVIGQF